uniref:Uncharacterized protein n=1 Tax=Rhizophora mucronata TaxID=61149 RepID=A0A2P2IQW1_RHIMU
MIFWHASKIEFNQTTQFLRIHTTDPSIALNLIAEAKTLISSSASSVSMFSVTPSSLCVQSETDKY